ncbi:MAG: hypothetical protein PHC64_10735 [Candidatus Gastranaerophilales bacterium]|nr:hypothetical protein [Candidatus Gastranaerophilales bacterium]
MSQNRKRFLITQSLLSSWEWGLISDKGYEDFLKTLERQPIQPTKAMLEGRRFENVLCSVLNGAEIEESHEWYKPITELQPVLQGAQQQVRLSRDLTVDGVNFVCYGVLDFLKAGIIYDTKYSKSYYTGKYFESPQTPMYFYLVPEAREFQYKICDGKYVYTERYYPDEVEPIQQTIKHFMEFLDNLNLVKIYCDNWISKY